MTDEWLAPVGEDEVVVPVGSITLFINLPEGYEGSISDETLASVERQVVEQFIAAAERHNVNVNALRILRVEARLGCITVVITVGIVVKVAVTAGAAIAAVGAFLKSYKDIREGLILMARDVKSVELFVKGRKLEQAAAVYREDLTDIHDKKQLNKDVDAAIDELDRRKKKSY